MQSYKWGFSFFQLYIMIAMVLVWTLGIYMMWLQAHLTMRKRGRQDVAGEQKAILELAESMRHNLMKHGHDPSTMTEAEIDKAMAEDLKGGSITYQLPIMPEGFSLRKGLKGWLVREKWWTIVLLLLLIVVCTVWMTNPEVSKWLAGPTAGIMVAMQLGSTFGSRMLVLLFLCLFWIALCTPLSM